MGIRDRPIAPRSPWQNGCAERLIGSIRRDCLDHVFVFGEQHLRHRGGRSDPTEQTAQTCSDAPLFEFAVGLVTKRDAAYIKVIVGA